MTDALVRETIGSSSSNPDDESLKFTDLRKKRKKSRNGQSLHLLEKMYVRKKALRKKGYSYSLLSFLSKNMINELIHLRAYVIGKIVFQIILSPAILNWMTKNKDSYATCLLTSNS